MNKPSILILFAHPTQHRSEINRPLFDIAQATDCVTAVDLYNEYPDFQIDVEKEQQRLRDHDVVIFQFPLYWYSTPAILKEWLDLVLEYGFAYGVGGTALKNKRFICAVSAGGTSHAYSAQGHNKFKIRNLLHPLEQTANLTGMQFLPPFVLFGARTAVEDERLAKHAAHWETLLKKLNSGEFIGETLQDLDTINPLLEITDTRATMQGES